MREMYGVVYVPVVIAQFNVIRVIDTIHNIDEKCVTIEVNANARLIVRKQRL